MAWDESGRLLAVGDAKTLQAQYPDAERIDAGEATVIPGLIDAHGHVMGLGYALMQADLVGARDKAEVVARLREYEKTLPEGAWLLGNGWDQNDWPDKRSEEHTSELQSLMRTSYAVFCLKKK